MMELVAAPMLTLELRTTSLMSRTGHSRTRPTCTFAPFSSRRSRRGCWSACGTTGQQRARLAVPSKVEEEAQRTWGRSGASCTTMACCGADGQPIFCASQ